MVGWEMQRIVFSHRSDTRHNPTQKSTSKIEINTKFIHIGLFNQLICKNDSNCYSCAQDELSTIFIYIHKYIYILISCCIEGLSLRAKPRRWLSPGQMQYIMFSSYTWCVHIRSYVSALTYVH